jgi:hypothetical protein
METLLEEQRRFNEERERLVDVMTKEILRKKASVCVLKTSHIKQLIFNLWFIKNREQINSDHLIKSFLDVIFFHN